MTAQEKVPVIPRLKNIDERNSPPFDIVLIAPHVT